MNIDGRRRRRRRRKGAQEKETKKGRRENMRRLINVRARRKGRKRDGGSRCE